MDGVDEAVRAGQVPGMLIPGLARDESGTVVLVEREAAAMREAVAMRLRGETLETIQLYLREHGNRPVAGARSANCCATVSWSVSTASAGISSRCRRSSRATPSSGCSRLWCRAGAARAVGAAARAARRAALPLRPADGRVLAGHAATARIRRIGVRRRGTARGACRSPPSTSRTRCWTGSSAKDRMRRSRLRTSTAPSRPREEADRAQAAYDAFTAVFDPTEPADVARRAALKAALDVAKEHAASARPPRTVEVGAGASNPPARRSRPARPDRRADRDRRSSTRAVGPAGSRSASSSSSSRRAARRRMRRTSARWRSDQSIV